MRKKFLVERASVLNTATAKTGSPFVVSAKAASMPNSVTASFGCKHCHTVFASNKGSEPFCVNCGSDEVVPSKAVAQALPATDKGLNAIHCKACGVHNVLSDVTASLLDGHLHCVECGTQLSYDVDNLEDPISDAAETDIEDALNTQKASNSPERRGGKTDDAPLVDVTEKDITDTLPTRKVTSETAPANEVPTAPGNGDAAPVPPASPVVAPMVDSIEDETMIEHADYENLEEDEQDACEYSDVSLAAVALAQNPKAVLTLASSENEILAFADGVPVARLQKADAGEHAAVFHTASYSASIARVAETQGLRAALAHFGFAAIRVKFPVGASVRARVAKRLQAQTAAVEEISTSHREDLLQCVSIASAALTKNLFRTKANALKRGFVDMLTTAGVKNANVMVDRVFSSHADTYHKQVFELAQELQEKPLDYRNTLSESMGDMNTIDQGMPNDENQEVVIEHADSLETHMESASVRPFRRTVTAGATSGSVGEIRAAVGGKLF